MKKTKTFFIFLSCLALFGLLSAAAAVNVESLPPGTYPLNADLSCYVNAMGGVEFGAPLLTATELTVDESGDKTITMRFTKSSVTIYSVTCDTFIDAAPSYVTDDRGVTSGVIGYYDQNGELQIEGVSYTLSDDTALNASDEAVHYVDSITFPLDSIRAEYGLTLYINSNVMGVQFTNPNDKATAATYSATLTVDWTSVTGGAETAAQGGADVKNEQTPANVEEMDGLHFYRANGASDTAASVAGDASEAVSQRAYLNTTFLTVMGCAGAVLLLAGAILLICGIKTGKKREDDGK